MDVGSGRDPLYARWVGVGSVRELMHQFTRDYPIFRKRVARFVRSDYPDNT